MNKKINKSARVNGHLIDNTCQYNYYNMSRQLLNCYEWLTLPSLELSSYQLRQITENDAEHFIGINDIFIKPYNNTSTKYQKLTERNFSDGYFRSTISIHSIFDVYRKIFFLDLHDAINLFFSLSIAFME